MVLEVDLDHFIGETEHNSMSCSHPLLDVDDVLDLTLPSLYLLRNFCIRIRLLCAFKIASEVLQQSYLLL